MQSKRPSLNLVVIGRPSVGKTMTTGCLGYKCGDIDKRALEKFELQDQQNGFHLSWRYFQIMQNLQSIPGFFSPLLNHIKFKTAKYCYTVIEASTHQDFIKEIILGTSQADVVLLIVSASKDEFELTRTSEDIAEEHILLSSALCGKPIIVAVNKMDEKTADLSQDRFEEIKKDEKTVNWSQNRFEKIKKKISEYIAKVGYDPRKVSFIPISSWAGANVTEKCSKMPWYNGPTLIEALDSVSLPKKDDHEKSLRLPVLDKYKIPGIGTVAIGKVESGTLKPSMNVCFAPSNIKTEVSLIEREHEMLEEAVPGDTIGFKAKRIKFTDIKRGYVCGDENNDPPREAVSFCAQIHILNHPTKIVKGYSPILYCHTARVACKFAEIKEKIDRRTGTVLEYEPENIKSGESAIVTLIPLKPLCVEAFEDYPSLGRFILKDMKNIAAIGIIKSVVRKPLDISDLQKQV